MDRMLIECFNGNSYRVGRKLAAQRIGVSDRLVCLRKRDLGVRNAPVLVESSRDPLSALQRYVWEERGKGLTSIQLLRKTDYDRRQLWGSYYIARKKLARCWKPKAIWQHAWQNRAPITIRALVGEAGG